jgi:hypothetical protein
VVAAGRRGALMTASGLPADPVETVDRREEIAHRRSYWAALVCKFGLQKRFGVAVRRIPGARCWGIFVEPYEPSATDGEHMEELRQRLHRMETGQRGRLG